jgi:hypothetical protein
MKKILLGLLISFICLPVWAVGTFTFTVSTNKMVITQGTSGAFVTNHDAYVADQAGTGTILNVAENGAAAVTLDYQIRPTHSKALIIKCIVTLKTAEADYIFITGTDAWDAAQTESLDVTAGNGTYTTTKRFKTITNLDCSDNAAGGGAVWANGKIAVTQDIWGVVWENVLNANYKYDCAVYFGDGSTSTYFTSKNEMVYFADNMYIRVDNLATLQLGELQGNYGINGSRWSFGHNASIHLGYGANSNVLIYASMLKHRTAQSVRFNSGNIDIRDTIFNCSWDGSNASFPLFASTLASLKLVNVNFKNVRNVEFDKTLTSDSINNWIHYADTGIIVNASNVTLDGLNITQATTRDIQLYPDNDNLIIKDPLFSINTVKIDTDGKYSIAQYTCNIHIADSTGANLSGVTVQCQTFGNVVKSGASFYKCIVGHTSGVFATDLAAGKWELTTSAIAALADCIGGAGTGEWVTGIAYVASASSWSVATDANGNIAEQVVNYKQWVGTSEALLTRSPHTFTLTYGGDTLIYPNITVDHPLVLRWEMPIESVGTLLDARVQAIYDKLPTNYLMGSSDVDNHDTDIDSILTDSGTTLPTLINDVNTNLETSIGNITVDNNAIAVAVRTEMDANSTQLATIIADTNELKTDDIPGLISAFRSAMDSNFTVLRIAMDANFSNINVDFPTAEEIRAEIDSNSSRLALIYTDVNGTIPALIGALVVPDVAGTAAGLIAALNNISIADVNTAVTNRLNLYDPPTKAEMDIGFAGISVDANSVDIANQVWSTLIIGFSDPNNFGGFLQDAYDEIIEMLEVIPTKPSKPGM